MAIKPELSGSLRALFVHFLAVLMPFSFWKVRSIRHLFLLRFSFSFFLPWQPEYGINFSSQNSIIFCLLALQHRDTAIKNAWKWKKIDGCRTNFNYCVKAHTSPSREEDWKRKRWKIIIFVSAFYEKEGANFGNKKCPVGVKGHGVVHFFKERSFSWQTFFSKKDKDLQWWDQCKNQD